MNGAVPLTPAQETRPIPLVAKARQNAWSEPIRPGGAAAQVLRRLGRTVPTVPVLRGEAFCRALRARHLDPLTPAFPTRHPAATALHLGCGLDGRVDRVRPSLQVRGFDLELPGGTALRRMVDPRTEGSGHRRPGAPVTGGLGRTQRPTDRPTRRVPAGLLTDLLEADVRALATRLSGPLAPGERRFDMPAVHWGHVWARGPQPCRRQARSCGGVCAVPDKGGRGRRTRHAWSMWACWTVPDSPGCAPWSGSPGGR